MNEILFTSLKSSPIPIAITPSPLPYSRDEFWLSFNNHNNYYIIFYYIPLIQFDNLNNVISNVYFGSQEESI